MTTTAYIFDLDDTIVDASIFSRIYRPVIDALLEQLDMKELELQEYINRVKEPGQPRVDMLAVCRELGATELYYKVLERYIRHTYTLKKQNIRDIFKKIKEANKRIGIVSGEDERSIELFLTRFDLAEHVDFVASGDKSTVLFWITLAKKHELMKEYVMVVDNDQDILDVAEHAGYKTLHVKELDNLEKFEY